MKQEILVTCDVWLGRCTKHPGLPSNDMQDLAMAPCPFVGLGGQKFGALLIDPPWRFQNRTGKVAPEHRRLSRYSTMAVGEICALFGVRGKNARTLAAPDRGLVCPGPDAAVRLPSTR